MRRGEHLTLVRAHLTDMEQRGIDEAHGGGGGQQQHSTGGEHGAQLPGGSPGAQAVQCQGSPPASQVPMLATSSVLIEAAVPTVGLVDALLLHVREMSARRRRMLPRVASSSSRPAAVEEAVGKMAGPDQPHLSTK